MNYKVNFKERFYFTIMLLSSLALYYFIGYSLMSWWHSPKSNAEIIISRLYMLYFAIFIFFSLLSPLLLKGYLIGNAIKITPNQFPVYDAVIKNQSALLQLKKAPEAYILQSGGMLNAFATRIWGKNYLVLYSDVLAHALKEGQAEVEFIIAHELGHIKRNHVSSFWNLLIWPAHFIPFLFKAYSRAREYTCDNIGFNVAPAGAEKGLLLLVAGKHLMNHLNTDDYLYHYQNDKGLSTFLAEIFSTHPLMTKRISALKELIDNKE
ncbi:M48 family peptidase [bacterium]|nr:M48 family peptidase [bacterium]NBW56215.1 M48 family peptidase [bacterium]